MVWHFLSGQKQTITHIRNIDALECVVAARQAEFQFKTLLKQTETRNGNRYDLLVFTIKTFIFLYAGTLGHVVDIINTFYFFILLNRYCWLFWKLQKKAKLSKTANLKPLKTQNLINYKQITTIIIKYENSPQYP